MITLNNISLQRGTKQLFKEVNLTVFPGKRIGIVGINGSGKSSLFSMFLRKIQPDAGDIYYKSNLEISYLAQETPDSPLSAIEYIMEGDVEITDLFNQLDKAEKKENHELIVELHSKIYEANGYALKSKAAKILEGLGFENAVHDKKVNDFSGGWRIRLNLAKTLMCRSELLLLDEPTNHLDLDAIIWLEKWLKVREGMIILISHDREFLDKVAQQIWHVDQKTITSYSGNYSFFENQYSQKLMQLQANQKKQQDKIDHMTSFISRFRSKASKAKQAQSRIKALGKLEKVAQMHINRPINFEFKECEKTSSYLVDFKDVSFGYEKDKLILDNVGFSISPGERIGLLGKNGMGKTTLVKMIAGKLIPKNGIINTNNRLKIGYFAQHQMEQLIPNDTPLQHFQDLGSNTTEKDLRNFLGGFGFPRDMTDAPVKNFSGGEKARLVLALLVFQKPNLLLLDEPTNHLDLEMRESLSLALQTFSGALLVVAHDRHLLGSVVDELWLIHDKKVAKFDGDLTDYENFLTRPASPKTDKSGKKKTSSRAVKTDTNRLKNIEKSLEELSKQKKLIESDLSDINMNDNPDLFSDKLQQFTKIDNKIKKLEEDWLTISNENQQRS